MTDTINYFHVIQNVKCLDCGLVFEDIEVLYKSMIISESDWGTSSEMHLHCPKCDSENLEFPDSEQLTTYSTINTMEWISVKKKLPRKGVRILAYFEKGRTVMDLQLGVMAGKKIWQSGDGTRQYSVTFLLSDCPFWMPRPELPEPPKS